MNGDNMNANINNGDRPIMEMQPQQEEDTMSDIQEKEEFEEEEDDANTKSNKKISNKNTNESMSEVNKKLIKENLQ